MVLHDSAQLVQEETDRERQAVVQGKSSGYSTISRDLSMVNIATRHLVGFAA
jgi:hypothetical protein